MDRNLALRAAGAALVILATTPTAGAWAAGWLPPVGGGAMILEFGSTYAGGTHRGVDLAAEAGAMVSSPADAVVTFAGAVPADGGGTCGAVTLELSDGQRVSLLPLDDVSVAGGDRVRAGDPVGAVASRGDDSSTAVHLHVGLRRGDLYLDPGTLLTVPPAPEPEAARESVVIPQAPVVGMPTAAGGAAAPAGQLPAVSAAVPCAGPAPGGEEALAPAGVASAPNSVSGPVNRHPIRDADTPRPSSVLVQGANAMSRPSAHLGVPVTRAVTGWLLALGMSAVSASIVCLRRASAVRVH